MNEATRSCKQPENVKYLPQLFCCTEGSKPRDYFAKNDFRLNRTYWSMHCHLQLIHEDVDNACLCEPELMSGSEMKKKSLNRRWLN